MRAGNRFTGVISYAGLDEHALWEKARHFFAADSLPERFRGFLPVFPMELIVNMPYTGPAPFASPAGFSMRASDYHRVLSQELPDLYQGDNRARSFDANGRYTGGIVTVDEAWAELFPQYRPFMGDRLTLHMIGGGHQAAAVPESIFPRGGGVLARFEREAGVTERCQHFAAFLRERTAPGVPCDHAQLEALNIDLEAFGLGLSSSMGYPMIVQFQALGRAKESLVCSILRKGALDIPLLFVLDKLLPLYGCMMVQPIVDSIALVVVFVFYKRVNRSLMQEME